MNVERPLGIQDSNQESSISQIEVNLENKNLTEEQKENIKKLLDRYNEEVWEIWKQTREDLNSLIKSISEAKNYTQIRNVIQKTDDYKSIQAEFRNINRNSIINIQNLVGTSMDWGFWTNTYLAYKTSPLSRLFNIEQLEKWRKVWENKEKFLADFKKLANARDEIMPILENEITPDTIVIISAKWEITIFKDWDLSKKEVLKYNEIPSLEERLYNSLRESNISELQKIIKERPRNQDRINLIKKLIEVIVEFNEYDSIRKMFLVQEWEDTIVNFPEPSNLFTRLFTSEHIFWDYRNLEVDWTEYIRTVNSWKWFISSSESEKSWKRLIIKNWVRFKNLELSQKQEFSAEDLWKWLDWGSRIGWNNVCWRWVIQLLNWYWNTMWVWNILDISKWQYWHWANIDNFLEWEISPENPFVLTWNNIVKSKEEFKKQTGLDFDDFLNKNIEVKKSWPIDFPKDAPAWSIIVFREQKQASKKGEKVPKIKSNSLVRRQYGHAEIVWSDWNFNSYYSSPNPAGSARVEQSWEAQKYKEDTWFTWYYYTIDVKKS